MTFVVCYVVFVLFRGRDYMIVDFSLNCVYSCYKWHDLDIFVYLRVFLISCPCFICNVKA
jgi:hypothetical protein